MKSGPLLRVGLVVALVAAGGYFLWVREMTAPEPAKRGGRPTAVPVVVAKVAQQNVPVTVQAVGNAEAFATVSVKSRVDGEVMEVDFQDGQAVKAGDLLYSIDPRPFQAQLNQAQAVLGRDQAQLANARADLKRTEELNRKGYATQQQLDLARTSAAALEQTVKTDEAAIEGVKLQLSYTQIRAPFAGRASDTQVDAGNLIKANDATMVVINQTKPIYVSFSVPAQYAFEIRQRMAHDTLPVEVSVPGSKAAPRNGVVTFIDNAIDSGTGTVLVKAKLPNDDEFLLPGEFVTVDLVMANIPDAVVVPSQAVQVGQKGTYVYIVKPDETADMRPVEVGETSGDLTVIRSGLSAGETVVTDGQLRLYPGVRVKASGAAQTAGQEIAG